MFFNNATITERQVPYAVGLFSYSSALLLENTNIQHLVIVQGKQFLVTVTQFCISGSNVPMTVISVEVSPHHSPLTVAPHTPDQ